MQNALRLILFCLLLFSFPARAFTTYYDLQEMERRATLVVRASVIETTTIKQNIDGQARELKVANLRIESVLSGTCEKQVIQAVYGDVHFYDESGFVFGEECLLCLVPYRDGKDLFYEINHGHGKMVITRGQVDFKTIKIPEHAKELLKNKDIKNVQEVLKWFRGPQLTVKPAQERFRFDKAIELEVSFTNPTQIPMPLMLDSSVGLRGHFVFLPLDEYGFPILKNEAWGGAPEKYNPDLNYPNDDSIEIRESDLTKLAPHQTHSGKIHFHLHNEEILQFPERTHKLSVYYLPVLGKNREVWNGWKEASCSFKLECKQPDVAKAAQLPNAKWACLLSTRDTGKITATKALLTISLNRPAARYDPRTSSGSSMLTPAVFEKLLVRHLQICSNEKVVREASPDHKELENALGALPPYVESFYLEFDIANYFKFEKGEYTIRWILPDVKNPSLSNVLKIKVE